MNLINRALVRRRKGTIRSVILLLLLALMVILQLLMAGRGSWVAAEEHAAYAVRQVALLFDQLIEDGFRQLNLAAASIAGGGSEETVLRALKESGTFSEAMIISGGSQRDADGVKSPAARSGMYILHGADGISGRIISRSGGEIQLSVSIGSGELTARLSERELESIFQSAYPGEYGFALFDASTGAWIINRSPYAGDNYYSTLMSMNRGGSLSDLLYAAEGQGHAAPAGAGGERHYIAHCRTGVLSWSIVVFLPESLLADAVAQRADWLALVVTGMQLLVLALYLVYIVRRRNSESRMQREDAHIHVGLLRHLAREAGSALYVYNRGHDEIESAYDGLNAEGAAVTGRCRDLRDVARAFGAEDEDVDMLSKAVRQIGDGGDAELKMQVSGQNGDRSLCFKLHCSGERVICSVTDNSAQEERIAAERAQEDYRRSMAGKCACVWRVNVPGGKWRLTDGSAGRLLGRNCGDARAWRSCAADIAGALKENVHPEDYPEFAQALSPEGVAECSRCGSEGRTMDFRLREREEDGYAWHRMNMRCYYEAASGELAANVFITNVNAEKNAELERRERSRILQQTLTALGGVYYGLYYIDLDGDLSYAAKPYDGKLYSKLCMPFRESFRRYAQREVHEEDREELLKLLDPYYLRKCMTENSHLIRREFRRRKGEDYEWAAVVIQAARFENGTVRDAVVAMRRIDRKRDMN